MLSFEEHRRLANDLKHLHDRLVRLGLVLEESYGERPVGMLAAIDAHLSKLREFLSDRLAEERGGDVYAGPIQLALGDGDAVTE